MQFWKTERLAEISVGNGSMSFNAYVQNSKVEHLPFEADKLQLISII